MVMAGAPVDAVIGQLEPFLEPGDIVMDGGNSHFRDTDRRGKALAVQGIDFFGVGISGGESGARYGPSLMPGGPKQAYSADRAGARSHSRPRATGRPAWPTWGPVRSATSSRWCTTASNTA